MNVVVLTSEDRYSFNELWLELDGWSRSHFDKPVPRSTLYRWLEDAFIGTKSGSGYGEDDLKVLKSLCHWYFHGGSREEFRKKLIEAEKQ